MADVQEGLICAYDLDGAGGARSLGWAGIDQPPLNAPQALRWVHLERTHPTAQIWLHEKSGLDETAIRALLAEETRPRCTRFDDGVLLNLRGVNLDPDAEGDNLVAIRLWITPERIISARLYKIAAIADIRQSLDAGQGPKTVGQFIARLAARLTERMEPTLEQLQDELSLLEERMLEQAASPMRKELGALRRRAIGLRRYIGSQREALAELGAARPDWLDEDDRVRLNEQVDRVTRYMEDLDMIRERAFVLQDELYSQLSDRMNRIVYMLTVITGIFLPISFLTGLFGVNIGGMPGVESSEAFFFFVFGMAGLVIVELLIFRFLKWI